MQPVTVARYMSKIGPNIALKTSNGNRHLRNVAHLSYSLPYADDLPGVFAALGVVWIVTIAIREVVVI